MKCMKVPYLTSSSYYRSLRLNIYPFIKSKRIHLRTAVCSKYVQAVPQKVDIAGDGQPLHEVTNRS
jgi:hypothetical protein